MGFFAYSPAFFYTVRTDKGIRFYECSSVDECIDMVNRDGLIALEVLTVDTHSPNILDFIVYGEKK